MNAGKLRQGSSPLFTWFLSNGLQPTCDGLQPNCDGGDLTAMTSNSKAMAFNLTAVAFNLKAMGVWRAFWTSFYSMYCCAIGLARCRHPNPSYDMLQWSWSYCRVMRKTHKQQCYLPWKEGLTSSPGYMYNNVYSIYTIYIGGTYGVAPRYFSRPVSKTASLPAKSHRQHVLEELPS